MVFPAARALYVDIFPGNQMPMLDANSGGSGLAMVTTLDKAVASMAGSMWEK